MGKPGFVTKPLESVTVLYHACHIFTAAGGHQICLDMPPAREPVNIPVCMFIDIFINGLFVRAYARTPLPQGQVPSPMLP